MDRSVKLRQVTLSAAIGCKGVGLHTGQRISMRLCPAEPDTGIVFHRTDLDVEGAGGARIQANWANVVDTRMSTKVANSGGASVGTVEHLLAAFSGCGIDNVIVELDGPEVPVMDGSAEPFVFLVECAGMAEQDAKRRTVKVLKTVEVGDAHRSVRIEPDDAFSLSIEIDFEAEAISRQSLDLCLVNGAFKSDISRARTFGFSHEVSMLRQAGLALGGSLDNAVVVSGSRVLNKDGLRFEDEFVRHKMLDCIGDLYLAGAPLLGHVHGWRSGHNLHNRLLRALFADDSAWCYVDAAAEMTVPAGRHW
ncbi:MAG: UDP-3-O-acyl-N-acetylglucosamine deacetylase, partial [Alphaproteobacteria bacterium]